MSVREDIAIDIVQDLKDITNPTPVIVSRNPIKLTDLSIAQFPAIIVQTTNEIREDATMQPDKTRMSEAEYTISAFVRADSSATTLNNNIDTQRNNIIEAISEKLEEDRTRNSKALNSFVTAITTDDGTPFPIGRVDITFQVLYKYTRGTL